eukprot:TRINITY_DN8050_c0_g2_i1.p1 TRINITY_DN8050_c0_g2~~TRINITY_DN8050_c0_g2_i1.p1  ORF type:complete len:243 (+),score=45.55 TRINITY_DN8050_c0_g2_i1:61-789(+)
MTGSRGSRPGRGHGRGETQGKRTSPKGFACMTPEAAAAVAEDYGRRLHELPWLYLDSVGTEYGPIPGWTMRQWLSMGRFPVGGGLNVRLPEWDRHFPLHQLYADLGCAFLLPPAWPDFYEGNSQNMASFRKLPASAPAAAATYAAQPGPMDLARLRTARKKTLTPSVQQPSRAATEDAAAIQLGDDWPALPRLGQGDEGKPKQAAASGDVRKAPPGGVAADKGPGKKTTPNDAKTGVEGAKR